MKISSYPELVQHWRELQEAGIPLVPLECRVGVKYHHPDGELTIRQVGSVDESEVRELKWGHIVYIAKVFIRRNLPGKTIIREAWISPPWTDPTIEWLEDPGPGGRSRSWYSFHGDDERFNRKDVLNHRIQGVLSRGQTREGLLLAEGSFPILESYRNHDIIPITFAVVDQWGREHFAELRMRLIRCPTRTRELSKRALGLARVQVDTTS